MEHLKNRRISNPYENSDRIFFHPLFNLRFYIEKKKFLNIKINKIHSPLNIYYNNVYYVARKILFQALKALIDNTKTKIQNFYFNAIFYYPIRN